MTIMLSDRDQCRMLSYLKQCSLYEGASVLRCAVALAVLAVTAAAGRPSFSTGPDLPVVASRQLHATVGKSATEHRRAVFEQRRQQFSGRSALVGNEGLAMELRTAVNK
ncbi:MAG: hypothetical protein EBT83_00255 [Betaproteobacteria bacterium]|jgi:hypothetical protein|nr:hypothetical protein [Betaproteobacteria bacterium]